MAVRVGVEVRGLQELESNLRLMGTALSKSTMRAALRKVAKPIAADAASRAPRGESELKPTAREVKSAAKKGRAPKPRKRLADSIVIRSSLGRYQRRLAAARGVAQAPVRVFIGPTAPHGHLIEFGHRLRRRDKNGRLRTVGFVPPRPFLRPAWDAHRARLLKELKPELQKAIERTARRLSRQARTGKLSKSAVRSLTS